MCLFYKNYFKIQVGLSVAIVLLFYQPLQLRAEQPGTQQSPESIVDPFNGDRQILEISSPTLDLRDLLLEISSHHDRVRVLALRAGAAKASAGYKGWKYPDPRLGIVWSNFPYKKDLRLVRDKTPMTGIEFQLRQPIPFPGRLTLQAAMAEHNAAKALIQLAQTKNRIVYGFLMELNTIKEKNSLYALTHAFTKKIHIVSSVARTRYSVGRGNLADVSSADLKDASFQQAMEAFRGQSNAGLHHLAYYMIQSDIVKENKTQQTLMQTERLQTLTSTLQKQKGLLHYTDFLLERLSGQEARLSRESLTIALIEQDINISAKSSDLARMDYLPDFEIYAAYRKREKVENDPAYGEDFFSAGFSLRVPLWSALSTHHKINASNKQLQALRLEHSVRARQVHSRVLALQALQNSERLQIDLYNLKIVPRARQTRNAARLAYQTGQIDFSALLQSWEVLYQQEVALIRLQSKRRQHILEMAFLLNIIVPEFHAKDANDES